MNHNYFIKIIRRGLYDKIYSSYNPMDMNEFSKVNDELCMRNIYLPKIIRRFIDRKYYSNISGDVYKEIKDSHSLGRYDEVEDFYNWVEDNPEYENLIDKEVKLKFEDLISDLDEELNYLKNKL